MVLKEVQLWLNEALSTITEEWETESRWLLCHVLQCSSLDLVFNKTKEVSEIEFKHLETLLKRRQLREPIQYILGTHEFMGLPFEVAKGVLIPRQDTESLVEHIIKAVDLIQEKEIKILDIGTGSGAIAIALAHYIKSCKVWSVDISTEALKIAKANVELNHLENRVILIESDLFSNVDDQLVFDIIVSNPPYIPISDKPSLAPEVSQFEPGLALFGGEDGLDFYRKIIPDSKNHLVKGGLLIFEAGHDQAGDVKSIFEKQGYTNVHSFCDLRGVPRFIYGYL